MKRILLPGGDTYTHRGDAITRNGRSILDATDGTEDIVRTRPLYPPVEAPDPALEREQALLGAVLLDACDVQDIDDHVHNFFLRQILDALAQVDLRSAHTVEDRVALAIRCCLGFGVDRVLLGRSHDCGFLAGCIQRAQHSRDPRPSRARPATAAVDVANDDGRYADAEDFDR